MRSSGPTPARLPFWIVLRAAVLASLSAAACAEPPGPDKWLVDVGRLDTDVLPVVESLKVTVYGPDPASPPQATLPEEQWTHIRGRWWFHREHDD